ncbi:FkbM family methyltransferase [Nostoc sp.]|uniref:FkbM family methyltransferase n=1 Tax=Nostoc sp. TaxID=1180 RepID=UPI002FFCD6E8
MNVTHYLITNLLRFSPKYLRLPLEYHYLNITGKLEREMSCLNSFITRKGRAIDIGANQGLYTYVLAKFCSVVEAFEPQPWCAELIVEYSKQFKKDINVYQSGLSSFNGTLTLKIPVIRGRMRNTLATGLASFSEQDCEHNSIDVPISRLDDYNFQDVVFIKIDVEGHERQVLEGARETILRERPTILIEIEQRHLDNISVQTVFNQIQELQYNGFFLQDGKLVSINYFDVQFHQVNPNYYGTKNQNIYINNFIFIPF